MTEITANRKLLSLHVIDPVAFILALAGGPLLVALFGFWLFLLPVAALFLGGPLYLVVGTPVPLWHLGRHPPETDRISLLSLVTSVVLTISAASLFKISGQQQFFEIAVFYCVFGAIFAPVWGAVTGWLYIRLRRDFFTQTL